MTFVRCQLALQNALVPLALFTSLKFFASIDIADVAPRIGLVSSLGTTIHLFAFMLPAAFAVTSFHCFRTHSALVPELLGIFANLGFAAVFSICNVAPRLLGIVSPCAIFHLLTLVDPLRLTMTIMECNFPEQDFIVLWLLGFW
jgi:hypothetical protein